VPPVENGTLATWVGVVGTPQSVVRAAFYGLPLLLSIIGGDPMEFRQHVDFYHEMLTRFGKPETPIGVHSPGYVAATDAEALDEAWTHYSARQQRIGQERGWSPMTRAQYEQAAGPHGALFIGSPRTVAEKIVAVSRGLGLSRFDLKYSHGTLPHEKLMECIRLYGTQVAPLVREQLGSDISFERPR
jgi:alkanesulfonate monooxygenase SsuD/methylene tetrahydromethanopterin reductase-like flavin-dependent oxidoreductase (luciferase family)